MSENGEAARSLGVRGLLLMLGLAVILIASSAAWFNAGDKIIGAIQAAIGGLLGVFVIVYGRLSHR